MPWNLLVGRGEKPSAIFVAIIPSYVLPSSSLKGAFRL
jgi:hypothetical protein